ncbi:MAG: energy-coupling factor ABC transporter ATP-binding protein [Clostridia bacterium]|nr:energy-coupling factor ABC transporter ATP-binding protein [Clostridia bacterium]
MIEFKNVNFEYEQNTKVLEDISFKIDEGESVGLIGCNGAGKSTLMKVLLGLLPCDGEITVNDLTLNKKNLEEIRRKIGFVLQDSDNQMFMPTVYEDMMFGPLNYGHTKEEAEQRVDEVLEELNLTYLKHKYNHKISGGEKRMAAIATILTMHPKVILMDEPTTALDPENRRMIINTINSLKTTKLIASHDLDMILETCQRVILMHDGKIIKDAPTEEILTDKELLESNHMELPLKLQK